MTDYTVANALDVFSTTSPGTIQLYTTSGSFSTQFAAPATVTSTYNLSLPSTSGNTNQFCRITGSNSLSWNTARSEAVNFPLTQRTEQTGEQSSTTTSNTNVILDYFYYNGSSIFDNTPTTTVIIIGYTNNTTTCAVTVFDITNSVTLLTQTLSSDAIINAPRRRTVGTLTGVSTGGALWEVRVRRVSGTGTVNFYSYNFIGDDVLY